MASKGDRKYLAMIGAAIALLFAIEYMEPVPLDWKDTYAKDDRIPFGANATFRLLKSSLASEMAIGRISWYEWSETEEVEAYKSVIIINNEVDIGDLDWIRMLEWVREGGTAFIATCSVNEAMEDSLGLTMQWGNNWYGWKQNGPFPFMEDSINVFNFSSHSLRAKRPYMAKEGMSGGYIQLKLGYEEGKGPSVDREQITALAYGPKGDPIFVRVKVGNGQVLLHHNPLLFTNFYLMSPRGHEYASKAFSYLPQGPAIWDEYYKSGREGSKTPLRFILSRPALKWAWFLVLGTGAAFLFFHVKRRQRAVPVLPPPSNTSLEFVSTIGTLYFQNGNHADLGQKMFQHFKDYVRRRYYLSITIGTPEEISALVEKSGQSREQVQKLFMAIAQVVQTNTPTEQELLGMSQAIAEFKKKSV